MATYPHLLIIADGEVVESQLFQTSAERAATFVALAKDGKIGSLDGARVAELIEEIDEETATADSDEGSHPRNLGAEDYVDSISELLADLGFDVYTDELVTPDAVEPAVSAL